MSIELLELLKIYGPISKIINWESLKGRYLQDDLPIRLGNLASNLARIKSCTLDHSNPIVVEQLLTESKFFIEWTAADADIEVAAELVQLQVQLSSRGIPPKSALD